MIGVTGPGSASLRCFLLSLHGVPPQLAQNPALRDPAPSCREDSVRLLRSVRPAPAEDWQPLETRNPSLGWRSETPSILPAETSISWTSTFLPTPPCRVWNWSVTTTAYLRRRVLWAVTGRSPTIRSYSSGWAGGG